MVKASILHTFVKRNYQESQRLQKCDRSSLEAAAIPVALLLRLLGLTLRRRSLLMAYRLFTKGKEGGILRIQGPRRS